MRTFLFRTACLLAGVVAGGTASQAQVQNDPTVAAAQGLLTNPGNGAVEAVEEMLEFSSFWMQWRRTIVRQRTQALWRRFSPLAGAPVVGVAAGGAQVGGTSIAPVAGDGAGMSGWSMWVDASPAYLRDDGAVLRGKGYVLTSTLGLDRQVADGTVLGVSYSPSHSSAKTLYHNGRERTWSHMLGLYLNQRITRWLSLEAQGGYVHQRQKLRRQDILGTYAGRRRSNGYHFSAALNASKWLNSQVMLSGRAGIVATRDKWRGYTEYGPLGATAVPGLKQTLVQGVVEGGVAAWMEPAMPYVKVAYNRDLYRRGATGGSDRDDFSLTGGMMWFGSGAARGISVNAAGTVVLGRARQRHHLFSLSLKWAW